MIALVQKLLHGYQEKYGTDEEHRVEMAVKMFSDPHAMRFLTPWDFPVRVGPSAERGGPGGRGVFATRDIRAGEVLTFYPCDAMEIRTTTGSSVGGNPAAAARITSNMRGHRSRILVCPEGFHHEDQMGVQWHVHGDPAREDVWACGHLVNDPLDAAGVASLNKDPKTPEEASQAYLDYLRKTAPHMNCRFETIVRGMLLAVTAERDIRAGEELLVPYGYVDYWCGDRDEEVMHMMRDLHLSTLPPDQVQESSRLSERHAHLHYNLGQEVVDAAFTRALPVLARVLGL